MLDHVLGRPSSKSRRLQVLAVLSFWSLYLYRGRRHGPPAIRSLSKLFSRRLTAWQTAVATIICLYAARNFSALAGLACPEPMADMYEASFFRATWVLTALDAGFWTAMKIRTPWLRDLASIFFSLYYLVAAERADEKVRKVRAMITVEHLRVAWNKAKTPYLGFGLRLMRPRLTRWPPRLVRIPRPAESDYREPITGWLYLDGPLSDLEHHNRLVLDIPGGGFVSMDPRCNDDKLLSWASRLGLPVLSLDYKKAPEFPYPYALNECFDTYASIMATRGRCLGMSGREVPRIVVAGDSAGGNLAVAATLMIVETAGRGSGRRFANRGTLPPPDGLVCFYPALDMNIGNWMSDERMALISDRRMGGGTSRRVVRRKSMQYRELVGSPGRSRDQEGGLQCRADGEAAAVAANTNGGGMSFHAEPMRTRLATSSMISYFSDRVLTPEMMRAMIILYIGAHNRPDFGQDYLLSPVLAPEWLLADFPKIYLMTGERDPLVDDTVVFAARLRRAKEAARRKKWGGAAAAVDVKDKDDYDDDDEGKDKEDEGSVKKEKEEHRAGQGRAAEVILLPGVSHGFMQFPSLYRPAWRHMERSANWFEQLFREAEQERARAQAETVAETATAEKEGYAAPGLPASTTGACESSGEEDRPLEMNMSTRRANRARRPEEGREQERKQGNRQMPQKNGKLAADEVIEKPSEVKIAESNEKGQARQGSGSGNKLGKDRSLVKLNSSDDLLGRRMHGLASGLTGRGGRGDQ